MNNAVIPNQEFIVCSAIEYHGVVAVAPRHWKIIEGLGNLVGSLHWPINGIQGFLTSTGRFVSRADALVIARAAGQVGDTLLGSVLTSEDLWPAVRSEQGGIVGRCAWVAEEYGANCNVEANDNINPEANRIKREAAYDIAHSIRALDGQL